MKNNFVGIIPARYESSRFLGKPLALIQGKPMFWHVCTRARQCPQLDQILLATDDKRIYNTALELEIPVLMTRSDHASGTDRVLEAAQQMQLAPHSVVVNIQGDEPALNPAMISQLLEPFERQEVQVATLATAISESEAQNSNQVKIAIAQDGRALYFSRAPIPYHREQKQNLFWGHIGLYAFRMQTLQLFSSLPPSTLEKTEKLEQLRLLETNIPIQVVKTKYKCHGVDIPQDLENIARLMQENNI